MRGIKFDETLNFVLFRTVSVEDLHGAHDSRPHIRGDQRLEGVHADDANGNAFTPVYRML